MNMKKAFTLVELLVVIAIISVLAGLLLPVLEEALGQAQTISCLNTLKQTGVAFTMYLNDSNAIFPGACLAGGARANVNSWCFGGGQYDMGIGTLVKHDYTDRSSMYCPGHEFHGQGYKASITTHAHIDYGVGWSNTVENVGGLRRKDNSRYSPPYSGWGDAPTNCPGIYMPTLRQYYDHWYRGTGRFYGSRVIMADTTNFELNPGLPWCSALGNLTGKSPHDLPHLENINALSIDGSGLTIAEGFTRFGRGGFNGSYGSSEGRWWENVDAIIRGEN